MVNLNVPWEGVADDTGYLFSFAKSLAAAVKSSPYKDLAEDIIATSGFAFRMWVDADQLCPSATSIWDFECQKPWVESGGILCDYAGRYWGQDDIEEERRNKALDIIRKSIDNGIPAVAWDIDIPEWGLVTGYDDENQQLATLSIRGDKGLMPYTLLGKREIPILSVLTITGRSDKAEDDILRDTLRLAATHLKGEEWCDNAKGLEAYPALIRFLEEKFIPEGSWSLEYSLGTYAALKRYAYQYFAKMNLTELAELYRKVYSNWLEAFRLKTGQDMCDPAIRGVVAELLREAHECEKKALAVMEARSP